VYRQPLPGIEETCPKGNPKEINVVPEKDLKNVAALCLRLVLIYVDILIKIINKGKIVTGWCKCAGYLNNNIYLI
jgi:hypothetical protein